MSERRGGPVAGYVLAILICAPLLFFGWWTICLIDIVVAAILYHLPLRFGAKRMPTLLVGVAFLIVMGGLIGYVERSGFADPGSTGLQEAVQGILAGMGVISFPAGIVFGIVCVIDILPGLMREDPQEVGETEEPEEEAEEEITEPGQPQGGRTCSGCGALIFGNEERCWRCGKRV